MSERAYRFDSGQSHQIEEIMKIELDEHHGYKASFVELWQPMLNTELTPEEVLKFMAKNEMLPVAFKDNTVYVIHPSNA